MCDLAAVADALVAGQGVTMKHSGKTLLIVTLLFVFVCAVLSVWGCGDEDGDGDADNNGTDDDIDGNSNPFVVRPFGLGFTNIRKGGTDNLGGDATGGSGFIAAGDTFEATVAAYQYDAADDADADGIPDDGRDITDNGNQKIGSFAWDTTLSVNLDTPPALDGGTTGSLNGDPSLVFADFSGGTAGEATITDLTYSEVGSITLQADTNNYLNSGVDLSGKSLAVGRFYPDHFSLNAGSVTTPWCVAGGFTYMDQPELSVSFTLEAQNLNDVKTVNYDADLYDAGVADISLMAEDSDDGNDLSSRLNPTAATWVSGEYDRTAEKLTFSRLATGPDGPYHALDIGILISGDADGRGLDVVLDMRPDDAGDCTLAFNCTGKKIDSPTEVVWGLIAVDNVYGPEGEVLSLPVWANYFVSVDPVDPSIKYFDKYPSDTCTDTSVLTCADPDLADDLDWDEVTISGSNIGHGEAYTLTPTTSEAGSLDYELTVSTWLKNDWDSNGSYAENPKATATFGLYRGNDRIINWREIAR